MPTVDALIAGNISNAITNQNTWGGILYNVKSYNAKGDGSTDDTFAIQNTINAAAVNGGVVYFPYGTYVISTLTIPIGKPIMLVGQGWSYDAGAATTLKSNSASAMFTPGNGADGICIRDMELNGNSLGTYGWYGQYGNKARFENLYIHNFTNTGIYSREGLLVIKDSYIYDNTQYGIDINSDSWVYGNEISTNGVGIRVVAGGVRITDNLINSNTSYGVLLDGTAYTGNTVGWNLISGGYIGENTSANIMVRGDSTARNCRYNQISNTFIQQASTTVATGISLQNADFTQISGIEFLGGVGGSQADTGAISLNSAHDTQINGAQIYESTGIPLNIISSNDVSVNGLNSNNHGSSAASQYGVNIDSNSNRINLISINLIDTRNPGYSKGIDNAGSATVIIGYRLYTPVASPDSLGSAVYILYNTNTGKLDIYGLGNIGANAAVSSSATSLTVNLNEWYPDTNYSISVSPSWNTTWWITGKQVGQFTVNFGTAAPAAETIDWRTCR